MIDIGYPLLSDLLSLCQPHHDAVLSFAGERSATSKTDIKCSKYMIRYTDFLVINVSVDNNPQTPLTGFHRAQSLEINFS